MEVLVSDALVSFSPFSGAPDPGCGKESCENAPDEWTCDKGWYDDGQCTDMGYNCGMFEYIDCCNGQSEHYSNDDGIYSEGCDNEVWLGSALMGATYHVKEKGRVPLASKRALHYPVAHTPPRSPPFRFPPSI